MTVRFMPPCMVQYNSNLPAVVNAGVACVSEPTKFMLIVGAPDSFAGLALPPCQVPFAMIWAADEVSTRVSVCPFLMVIVGWIKVEPPILTWGPLARLDASTILQADSKTLNNAIPMMPIKIFLCIMLPVVPPDCAIFFLLASFWACRAR